MFRYQPKRCCSTLLLLMVFLTGFYFYFGQLDKRADQKYYQKVLDRQHRPPVTWHLRIIVLAFNRSASLASCLASLQHLHLDGTAAVLEVRVDRSEDGLVDEHVVQVAREFKWPYGETIVYIQQQHVGIHGQWVYSWQPASDDSREMAIILEDDIDISPFAFRWLREAHDFYDGDGDVAGYGLVDTEIPLACFNDILKPSVDATAFKFARFCTFGFSPVASVWRQFQEWYTEKRQTDSFKPYTPNDPLFTQWFKIFEKDNRTSSMWSMWFIRFCDERNLYTVYPNSHHYLQKHHPDRLNNTHLAFHRREGGLHFKNQEARSSKDFLLNTWYPDLLHFPDETPVYDIPHRVFCIVHAIRDGLSKIISIF